MATRIKGGKLYMGNLVSQHAFSFLWNSDCPAAAEFGFGNRKLSFFLKELSVEYKLELGFRDIWFIHLRNAKDLKLLFVQNLPGEIIVCTRAVINAASFVSSSAFPTFSILDSCSNVQAEGKQGPKLLVKQPTIGDTFIVCFVVKTPGMAQLDVAGKGSIRHSSEVEVQRGEWIWIGVFTQHSEWYTSKSFKAYFSMGNGIVEKGFIASGEEDRVMVPLRGLL